MSNETTVATDEPKKKNQPRHLTMMDREFDRLSTKLEGCVVEFANVSRARAILGGGKSEDSTVLSSVSEIASAALADQAAASEEPAAE